MVICATILIMIINKEIFMKPIHRRNTFQRQLIMEIICNVDNHPTADEIYQQILLRYSNISKATVYRNLNLLAEMGMIKKIECPDVYKRQLQHCGILLENWNLTRH